MFNTEDGEEIVLESCIFVKIGCYSDHIIYFTEYPEFPAMDEYDIILPVINKGWNSRNTRAFLFDRDTYCPRSGEISNPYKGEMNESGTGRYFMLLVPGRPLTPFDVMQDSKIIVFVKGKRQRF